jgi:hypothetical protein
MKTGGRAVLIAVFSAGACILGFRVYGLAPAVGGSAAVRPSPSQLASIEGDWQGRWVEVAPTDLTIERIDLSDGRATIRYRWYDHPASSLNDAVVRIRARIEDGALTWRYAGEHRVHLAADGAHLLGARGLNGKQARVVMTRRPADRRVPDAAHLPAHLAALLGTWRGTWEDVHPSELHVHTAGGTHAAILYRAEDDCNPFYGERIRATARVAAGRLSWAYGGHHSFELAEGGAALVGTRRLGGRIARVAMSRITY